MIFILIFLFLRMGEVYLFRHGTTSDNANGVFSGWRDVPLNEKGFKDAKIIALRLKDKKIDMAFRSSLLRSGQTLKEVLRFHPKCKSIIIDDRIRERNYGKLQGQIHLNIVKKYGYKKYDEWHRSYDKKAIRGESLKDVEKRVQSFIKNLMTLIKGRNINVAISAHGNSMRPFRRHFEKLSILEMMNLYNDYETVYVYKV